MTNDQKFSATRSQPLKTPSHQSNNKGHKSVALALYLLYLLHCTVAAFVAVIVMLLQAIVAPTKSA